MKNIFNRSPWVIALFLTSALVTPNVLGFITEAGAQYQQIISASRSGGDSETFSIDIFDAMISRRAITQIFSDNTVNNNIVAGVFDEKESRVVRNTGNNIVRQPVITQPEVEPVLVGQKLSRLKSNISLLEVLPLTGEVPSWLRQKYQAYSVFNDVSADNAYYEPTLDLYRMGIIQGEGNSPYMNLNGKLTRAAVAKMLAYTMEVQLMVNPNGTFSDVPTDSWFFPFVESLVQYEVLSGYPDGTFKPEQNVNFGEMLKLVAEATNVSITETKGTWQEPYYNALLDAKVIPSTLINADYGKILTRGEAFTLLQRAVVRMDQKQDQYIQEIDISIPEIGLSNLPASYTLPTDPSSWLTDLTVTGAGYYFDPINENYVIFGHSSIWPGDPSPYGAAFYPVLRPEVLAKNDTFSLNVNGEEKTYKVIEKKLISFKNADALRDSDPNVDALIFTCNTDLSERYLIRAEEI